MAKVEKFVFSQVGAWKSYEELEETMSLGEIFDTAEQISENNFEDKRFFASLKGIDLDGAGANKEKEQEKEVMERIVAKANAILNGQNPEDEAVTEAQKFAQMGVEYEVITYE